MTSYHIFSKLAALADPANHGIRIRLVNFFFKKKLEDLPEQLAKMHEIEAAGIAGFAHDPNLVGEHAVNQDAGIVDSYRHLAPVVDTDVYTVWLRALIVRKGAILRTGRISGDLIDIEAKLSAKYRASAIVNATGLQARELAGDPTVFPLRGALIRVVNDGKKFPRVTEALCVTHDESRPGEDTIVFIVPRNDRTLILGGVAQPDRWNLDLTLSSPEIQRIRTRCNAFVPGLENAELDGDAPLVQGLRPLTKTNVRVARETRGRRYGRGASRIVHSYGHGGSGFTLSFGCAADVLEIVQEIVNEEQPMDAEMARL
jgi:D-amino-acid oxidase